jgi:MarR family transcriptional regulator, transcriptional regulator for hemolysin
MIITHRNFTTQNTVYLFMPLLTFAPPLLNMPTFMLSRAAHKATRSIDEWLINSYQIVARDAWVLIAAYHNQLSQKAISDMLHINLNSMVAIVDRLEHLGYAKRIKDENNRRAYIITVTKRGEKVIQKWMKEVPQRGKHVMKPLSHQQLDKLLELLRVYLIDLP